MIQRVGECHVVHRQVIGNEVDNLHRLGLLLPLHKVLPQVKHTVFQNDAQQRPFLRLEHRGPCALHKPRLSRPGRHGLSGCRGSMRLSGLLRLAVGLLVGHLPGDFIIFSHSGPVGN